MNSLLRFLRMLGWLSFATWVAFLIYQPSLPAPTDVVPDILTEEPRQTAEAIPELNLDIDGFQYTLEPSYRYDLQGVVVSYYDSDTWYDISHQNDPGNIRDLCVVWGRNVSSGIYREVKYESGEFTCTFRWSTALNPPFDIYQGANNHVLPANEDVARKIRSVVRGDQIRMQGYLADYTVMDPESGNRYGRRTSTTRQDRGNGACEIVYVTDLEILKPTGRLPYIAQTAALWTFVGVLLLRLILVFTMPPPAASN